MNKTTINNKEVVFHYSQNSNQIFCTSLDVARVFNKQHKNVLRDIENILKDLRKIGDLKDKLNFEQTYRDTEIRGFGKVKGKTRKDPYYNLTRDGFSLLAMGFTGTKALQWKIAFLNAFNQMEKFIKEQGSNSYLNEIIAQISQILPSHDFKICFEIHDWNNNKKYSFHYEVGDAKFKKQNDGLLNYKFKLNKCVDIETNKNKSKEDISLKS